MGDIRVFPGVTFEGEMRKVTLTLVRMSNETQEAYVQRCQQVINLALSFVPKSEPAVVDFSDMTKYRKINEHVYEAITPGYRPKEETGSERDSHFANWAASLWDELHTLSTQEEIERYEAMDKEIIARAGYDLVYFLLNKAKYHSGSFDVGWGTPDEIHETIRRLPDMTAQPETEKE